MPRAPPARPAEPEHDEKDHESESESEGEKTQEDHVKISQDYKDVCREAFLAQTERFEWKGKYLLHALSWEYHSNASRLIESGLKKWPHVWGGGEPQPVMAAMWDTRVSGSKLVATWTMSLTGDETNLFYIEGDWQEDAWSITEEEGLVDGFPESCQNSFCVSSGDDTVDNFYCPALEGMGAKKAQPNAAKKSAAAPSSPPPEEEEEKKETQAPVADASMTVAQLKKLCQERGLAVTGRKQDLILRLNQGDSEEKITPSTQTKKRTRSEMKNPVSKKPARGGKKKPEPAEEESDDEVRDKKKRKKN